MPFQPSSTSPACCPGHSGSWEVLSYYTAKKVTKHILSKCSHCGVVAGEKAERLRTLLLQRTWDGCLAPTQQFIIVCNSDFRGSTTLFWTMRALHTCEFKASLVYKARLWTAKTKQRNPILKNKKKNT